MFSAKSILLFSLFNLKVHSESYLNSLKESSNVAKIIEVLSAYMNVWGIYLLFCALNVLSLLSFFFLSVKLLNGNLCLDCYKNLSCWCRIERNLYGVAGNLWFICFHCFSGNRMAFAGDLFSWHIEDYLLT